MVTNAQLSQQLTELTTFVGTSIKDLKDQSDLNKTELLEKISGINDRLLAVETQVDKSEEKYSALTRQVDENKQHATDEKDRLAARILVLENKLAVLDNLPVRVDKLNEVCEERTNRQLRETLVFRNVPESKDDETYAETKQYLAEMISEVL